MKVVRAVLGSAKPIVMDADALTQFAGKAGELRRATGPLLLTPHPGELGRLLGTSSQQVEGDRLAAVTAMVDLCRATVLLKGPYTVIGSVGEKPIIHAARAPMLATAGSGDVLAGILGAFCTGLAVRDAAQLGTFVHARSAEAWQQHNALADRGLLAHEVTDWVPRIIAGLANPSAPLPV
jgi:NAD(P)H-hydrate epimerase